MEECGGAMRERFADGSAVLSEGERERRGGREGERRGKDSYQDRVGGTEGIKKSRYQPLVFTRFTFSENPRVSRF